MNEKEKYILSIIKEPTIKLYLKDIKMKAFSEKIEEAKKYNNRISALNVAESLQRLGLDVSIEKV